MSKSRVKTQSIVNKHIKVGSGSVLFKGTWVRIRNNVWNPNYLIKIWTCLFWVLCWPVENITNVVKKFPYVNKYFCHSNKRFLFRAKLPFLRPCPMFFNQIVVKKIKTKDKFNGDDDFIAIIIIKAREGVQKKLFFTDMYRMGRGNSSP